MAYATTPVRTLEVEVEVSPLEPGQHLSSNQIETERVKAARSDRRSCEDGTTLKGHRNKGRKTLKMT
jgi:hypothetical protein